MSRLITIAGTAWIILASSPISAGDRDGKSAWPDVFIQMGMYAVKYDKPIVGKGDNPVVYQQTVHYIWSGGRFETISVTLARDPSFQEKLSPDAMKAEKTPAREVEINKRKAWHWKLDPNKLDKITNRLIVQLAKDKAIIIEQVGFGANLIDVAAKFDFDKVEKALSNPPAK